MGNALGAENESAMGMKMRTQAVCEILIAEFLVPLKNRKSI